jgi:glutathione peroxidase
MGVKQHAYDFSFPSLHCANLDLGKWRGKVMMVVNTASKCGFTSQYADLERLYQQYHSDGLEILAVPSPDFAGQEFQQQQEILDFCEREFSVSFPIADWQHVRKGSLQHPFFKWVEMNGGWKARPRWNFYKYLIDRNGHLDRYFYSFTSPMSHRVCAAIENALLER